MSCVVVVKNKQKHKRKKCVLLLGVRCWAVWVIVKGEWSSQKETKKRIEFCCFFFGLFFFFFVVL
eukprot:UN14249